MCFWIWQQEELATDIESLDHFASRPWLAASRFGEVGVVPCEAEMLMHYEYCSKAAGIVSGTGALDCESSYFTQLCSNSGWQDRLLV